MPLTRPTPILAPHHTTFLAVTSPDTAEGGAHG